MKKIIISSFAVALVALTACNDIEPADRFIEMPSVETSRVVLVEEFTGQKCPNCPTGHEILESIVEQYPENVVVVSIHAGELSIPESDGGLATPLGNEYANDAGISKYPSAIIDRSTSPLLSASWATAVYNALRQPSNFDLKITATYNPDTDLINIETDILSYLSGSYNYQLWITEDGIKASQIMPDGKPKLRYVHNNVFRAAANGSQGQAIEVEYGEPLSLNLSIAKESNWKAENLHIVGFIYSSEGVFQAASTAVEVTTSLNSQP